MEPRWSGTQRVRGRREPAPRGLDRLIAERLVEPGGPAAHAIEAVLNRLESPRSVSSSTFDLLDYLRFCRARSADPLGPGRDLVAAWLADTRARWAPLTRRRSITSVRRFYAEAIERGVFVGPNPASAVPRIPALVRADPPALTTAEVDDLLDELDQRVEAASDRGARLRALRDRLAIHVFLLCALRCAELVSLRWEDRVAEGPHRVVLVTGKGGRPAKVKVSPELDAKLDDYLAALVASGLEFQLSDPIFFGMVVLNGLWPPSVRRAAGAIMPWSTRAAGRMVDVALAEIGRDGRRTAAHLLRRTSGTLVYERTHDIYLAQQHLRHASPATTTKHYIRPADPLADAGIDHLDFSKGLAPRSA